MVGFSAQLCLHHIEDKKNKSGFISATPQRVLFLQTSHSPNFLGLNMNVGPWERSNYGEGIIIGMIDGGIAPKHKSFGDEGMSSPPSKWKGRCENGIICNKKLIGVKFMINSSDPNPNIAVFHGTHTASTAAGNFVPNANFFGQANGTSLGMAPRAHVAAYHVVDSSNKAYESHVLAGMDAAIDDGVDVMSMSLGVSGPPSLPYWNDTIARGAFAAIKKGIFVSCGAGNDGPEKSTVKNNAPWILTVTASSIDRSLRATVVLGNKEEFDGETINQPKDFPPEYFPLAFLGTLENKTDIKGKMVVGPDVSKEDIAKAVKDGGGVGVILINTLEGGYSFGLDAFNVPVSKVSYAAGEKILSYIKSTSNPKASLVFKGTILGVKESPMIAYFSSRGPCISSPGIPKPDITGPGVSILAAVDKIKDNSTKNIDLAFGIQSGTSMSTLHLSGVAALLIRSHPDWSPAATKSAIMTTAYTTGLDGNPIKDEQKNDANLVTLGSGHVDPVKALDPGLIYDIHTDDYIPYLCGLNYTDQQVGMITQSEVQCSQIKSIPEPQLNYPSFSVKLGSGEQVYSRTVTNVGEVASTYKLSVENCLKVDIVVSPEELVFKESNQKLTYTVTFRGKTISDHANYSGENSTCLGAAIIWSDGKHRVRIPIYSQDA